MHVKTLNNQIEEYPYSIEKFRQDYSNISFPVEISAETLASYGVYVVTYQATPEYNPATQKIEVSSSPSLVEGAWMLTKSVVNLTSNEITSNDITKATKVRATRTRLLQETDWCACSDVTMSAEMTAYRQALRDVPAQEGFPHNITWPTPPA